MYKAYGQMADCVLYWALGSVYKADGQMADCVLYWALGGVYKADGQMTRFSHANGSLSASHLTRRRENEVITEKRGIKVI